MSDYLRKKYQSEAVTLTLTAVEVSTDLRTGRVFVGIIGDEEHCIDRMRWLRKHAEEIRREMGRRVVLKWNPRWEYVMDDSGERGARILRAINAIEAREGRAPGSVEPTAPETEKND